MPNADLPDTMDTLTPLLQAARATPDDPKLHSNIANALYGLGRTAEAEARVRTALILKPDFPQAYSNLGVMAAGRGRLDEAAAALRRAAELDPSLLDIRLNVGIILNRLVGNRSGQALFGAERRHYESLPFPPRDPEAERYVLKVSTPDILAKMNQYCFGGGRDFTRPFRVLVAGCGTGDSAVWLGWQLKDTRAEIVALDLSEASLDVARARAKARGLGTIRWVHGSLLDVAAMGLGTFDYITCLGVLHHLPDPVRGLRALESVLADRGAMAIMLYGAVGRSHIYSTQRLLRLATSGLDHPGEKLAFARQIVANLPPTNDFRQREGVEAIQAAYLSDDTNFWDTLLHEQDRAYTASEVRAYLASARLHVQGWGSYSGNGAITGLQYDLDFQVNDPAQSARLAMLSPSEREDAAEILDGSLALHTVYATRESDAALDPMAPEAILAPMSDSGLQILAHLAAGGELTIVLRNGARLPYHPSPATRGFIARIDGLLSNAAIAAQLGLSEGSEDMARLKKELRLPTALHWVTARLAAGSRLPPLPDRNRLSNPLPHAEPSVLPL